jgi:hypothetical protein
MCLFKDDLPVERFPCLQHHETLVAVAIVVLVIAPLVDR